MMTKSYNPFVLQAWILESKITDLNNWLQSCNFGWGRYAGTSILDNQDPVCKSIEEVAVAAKNALQLMLVRKIQVVEDIKKRKEFKEEGDDRVPMYTGLKVVKDEPEKVPALAQGVSVVSAEPTPDGDGPKAS